MPEFVELTDHGPIREVALNRPRSLNALNLGLMTELADAMTSAATDSGVRAVLLTGRGRAFCAGGDLKWAMEYANDPGASLHALAGQLNRLVVEIRSMPKPVVAAIQGAAAGAGFMLALACDFRVMEKSAFFHQAYTSNGCASTVGGRFLCPGWWDWLGHWRSPPLTKESRRRRPINGVWSRAWRKTARCGRRPSPWSRTWRADRSILFGAVKNFLTCPLKGLWKNRPSGNAGVSWRARATRMVGKAFGLFWKNGRHDLFSAWPHPVRGKAQPAAGCRRAVVQG